MRIHEVAESIPYEGTFSVYKSEYGPVRYYNNMTPNETDAFRKYASCFFSPTIMKNGKEIPNDFWVTIKQLGGTFKRTIKICELLDPSSNALKDLPRKNLYFTQNSFVTNRVANRLGNLATIGSIVCDLDFLKTGKTKDQVLFELYEDYFGQKIPVPNIIESGRQIRLIWILENPVKLPKEKAGILGLVERVTGYFTRILQDFGSDYQAPNTYIRVPSSVNTKGWHPIEVISVSDYLYDFFEDFVDQWLPELPEGYVRKGKHTKFKSYQRGAFLSDFNNKRLEDLRTLQRYFESVDVCGYREKLCWLYRNYAILAGKSKEEALMETRAFNADFAMPLRDHELLSKTNNLDRKTYTHKAKTLANYFGLDQKTIEALGLMTIGNRLERYRDEKAWKREYNKRYYASHRKKPSRKYRVKNIMKKVAELKLKLAAENKKSAHKINVNARIKEILDTQYSIALSLRSIARYVKRAIEEGILVLP